MSKTADPTTTSIPLWITAGCLVAGVGLCFGNAMPALAEQKALTEIEAELETLKRRHEQAIFLARLAGADGHAEEVDLQSLFVAIDQKGYTISEFCAAWPVEDAAGDETKAR